MGWRMRSKIMSCGVGCERGKEGVSFMWLRKSVSFERKTEGGRACWEVGLVEDKGRVQKLKCG